MEPEFLTPSTSKGNPRLPSLPLIKAKLSLIGPSLFLSDSSHVHGNVLLLGPDLSVSPPVARALYSALVLEGGPVVLGLEALARFAVDGDSPGVDAATAFWGVEEAITALPLLGEGGCNDDC